MIEAEKANYTISMMCDALGLSKSGFHAWRNRVSSAREEENARLLTAMRRSWMLSDMTYGSPRIHADLVDDGWVVSQYRVARMMRQNGMKGIKKGRYVHTTDSEHDLPIAPNLLDRNFDVDAPNKVWVSDICYIWTAQGFHYLCVVLDLFNREIVGWAMDSSRHNELVLSALRRAILFRQPDPGLLFHSDRGSQYASYAFRDALASYGFVQSMSPKGDCFDPRVSRGDGLHALLDRSHGGGATFASLGHGGFELPADLVYVFALEPSREECRRTLLCNGNTEA